MSGSSAFRQHGKPRAYFAVVSDPHVTMQEFGKAKEPPKLLEHSTEMLEQTVAELNAENELDFVLFTGDMTKDGEPWNLDRFVQIADRLKIPYYVIFGNHEAYSFPRRSGGEQPTHQAVPKGVLTWTLQGRGFQGPWSWWSLDPLPGLHLVGLDTTRLESWGGSVSPTQLDWLERDLSAHSGLTTIVTGHHGILPFDKLERQKPIWENFYLSNADEAASLLEDHPQVCCYLSGHRHVGTAPVTRRGLHYINNPSTVSYPLRYTLYHLDGNELAYESREIGLPRWMQDLGRERLLESTLDRPPEIPDGKELREFTLEYVGRDATKDGHLALRSPEEQEPLPFPSPSERVASLT